VASNVEKPKWMNFVCGTMFVWKLVDEMFLLFYEKWGMDEMLYN